MVVCHTGERVRPTEAALVIPEEGGGLTTVPTIASTRHITNRLHLGKVERKPVLPHK